MSPDEQVVATFVAAAVRRARRLAALEAFAWALVGAGAAGVVSMTMRVTPAVAFSACVLVGTAAAAAWLVSHWIVRTSRRAVVLRIERAEPSLRNLLVTAVELAESNEAPVLPKAPRSSSDAVSRQQLVAPPHVRNRVFANAAAQVRSLDAATALSGASAGRAASIAAAVWLVAGGAAILVHARRLPLTSTAGRPSARSASMPGASGALVVTATIQPPGYTQLAARTIVDPSQIEAVEGSALTLTVAADGDFVTIARDESSSTVRRGAEGRFVERIVLAKTGFVVVSTPDGRRRIVPIVVTPDALPVVKLTAPGRDLIYSGGNPRIAFEARATDDFGLRDLTLQYTKVSGSGEQFEFKAGEIPLAVSRADPRDWRGTVTRALADLGLADGDMLVYRAVASDARPGDGHASSDAFFIQISKLGAAAGDAFTLPEEETRYALSQQMLIVKTERLIKQQPTMAPAAVAEAALNLAVEQRMIRAEFVFMLGGEVQDEEVEAQESTELQEGRQQNRGQRDVRDATQAMSVAGKYLTGAQLAPALAAERAAVAALQRAFSKDRYLLRALSTRNPLDLSRRLTGDLSQASDWRRRIADAPANRRAARLQDLLTALGALGRGESSTGAPSKAGGNPATEAGGDAGRRAEALVLAEQALRIDPDSAVLRQASADLQRVADTWTMTDADSRGRAIGGIAAKVAAEAGRAMAAAPAQLDAPSSALRGAFADALRAPRGER